MSSEAEDTALVREEHLHASKSAAKFFLEFSIFSNGPSPPPTAARPSPAPTFHKFPDLPPELRLKIWSHLVVPRVVTACCFERDDRLPQRQLAFSRRSRTEPWQTSSHSSSSSSSTFNTTCPAILLVCRESRAVGLAHYELAFGWRISPLLSDTPIARPPRVWFNFALDALYLVGELEAYDQYGFNSPMVYFFDRRDAKRVRHLACAFEELRYPEQGSDQIFGCLWHVVDRFAGAGRLLVTVTAADEEAMSGCRMLSTDNVMQKIWNGWMLGTTVTTSNLANTQILLVREEELAHITSSHADEDESAARS
ncbi:hypothetical protein CTRI78_v005404 [Colletotrichum trifolii]|uniref:2EXR domain-containing protein n=1 Tax=Colletotrichum trifolii TaxID=5466 RepID=A0A4R8RF29_COLTR|nr:hypothetical protein CTRI78_v005404 [Colletotrichum trifolii]